MRVRASFVILLSTSLFGCSNSLGSLEDEMNSNAGPGGGSGGGQSGGDGDPLDPPTVCDTGDYVAPSVLSSAQKVKTTLTGGALTNEEVAALNSDASALRPMVAEWTQTSEARGKLLAFFRQAFQQEGFEDAQLGAQFDEGNLNGQFGRVSDDSGPVGAELAENVRSMFPNTVLDMLDNGEPFNTTVTTSSFMLTPALMTFLAFHDEQILTDSIDTRGRLVVEYPGTIQRISLQNIDAYDPTDFASVQSFGLVDPESPNFMRFYSNDPELITASGADCTGEVVQTVDDDAKLHKAAFRMFVGTFRSGFAGDCRQLGAPFSKQYPGVLAPSDFSSWRRVTIRTPEPGEETARFYELDRFRDPNVTELVLNTPRIGFMTTLAFFSVWETNPDNQSRVTANQMLITAYGYSIDDSGVNFPVIDDALDGEHADPTTTCYACHRSLDPLRQYFRRDYTYLSSRQTDTGTRAVEAGFAWNGNDLQGGGMAELTTFLSTQDGFAEAWIQKLCFYANSEPCPENSNEFRAMADSFRASDYDFLDLVANLYSSSLITGATCIDSTEADSGSIARQRHFCNTLETRTEMDMCGRGLAQTVAPIIADDGFSRGDADPITLREPSLVTSASFSVICEYVASQLVGNSRRYRPGDAIETIPVIVTELMGHPPSDPFHQPAVEILTQHFNDARGIEVSPFDALRSVVTAACVSPSVTGVGF